MNTKEPEYSVEEENTERLIGRANRLGYTITSIEIEPGRVAISIPTLYLIQFNAGA